VKVIKRSGQTNSTTITIASFITDANARLLPMKDDGRITILPAFRFWLFAVGDKRSLTSPDIDI